MSGASPHLLFLCTGNAARSVMAGAMLNELAPHVRVTTAGTFAIEGLPMSMRTRDALAGVGLTAEGHRSRQVEDDDLGDVDLVVAMAVEHVRYMRGRHPDASARTGTLKRLTRDLPSLSGPLPDRVSALRLDEVDLEDWEDVHDPAGGDNDVFVSCAREILELTRELVLTIEEATA